MSKRERPRFTSKKEISSLVALVSDDVKNVLIDLEIVKDEKELRSLNGTEFFKRIDDLGKTMMEKTPNELQEFVNAKLENIPEERRDHARLFIQQGIKRYISQKTNPSA